MPAMPLVDYESDDDAASDVAADPKKRKLSSSVDASLPSLPEQFHDLYATSARSGVKDDPSLHEGRSRTIPHIEGNWPSHVYIECKRSTNSCGPGADYCTGRPDSRTAEALESIIMKLAAYSGSSTEKSGVKSLLKSPLGTNAPLHVSLSRSLSLTGEQKEPFIKRLETALHKEKARSYVLSDRLKDRTLRLKRTDSRQLLMP